MGKLTEVGRAIRLTALSLGSTYDDPPVVGGPMTGDFRGVYVWVTRFIDFQYAGWKADMWGNDPQPLTREDIEQAGMVYLGETSYKGCPQTIFAFAR